MSEHFFEGSPAPQRREAEEVPDASTERDELAEVRRAQEWLKSRLNERGASTPGVHEMRSRHFAEEESMNYNDDFLDVMKPFVSDRKVLDIFAGSQKTREFYQREGVNVSVTSVDITPGRADLAIDVSELAKHLKPEKQFRFVFSFGAHPGFTNYDDIRDLLDDDGFLVTGGSAEQFERFELPALALGEARGDGPYAAEIGEILKGFAPVAAVKVLGIKGWYGPRIADENNPEGAMDKAYVLWRKRAS